MEQPQIRCAAPAKLNLFLHVTGRRPDGYHLLQTAFQLIDRCDYLTLERRDDGQICRVNDIDGVPEPQDLIVRASRLLQQASASHFGVNLHLEKQLPMGGGLGGGSSDAASTLMALNQLWQCGFSREQLMALGLQLGADVPFFIFGHNAFAEGIGEQLQRIDTPERWFLVIEPGVQVPTPLIFSAKELTRNTKPVRMTDFSNRMKMNWRNDLQEVACRLFPEVAEAILCLQQFGEAMMTGSGACVFCAFDDELSAQTALQKVMPQWRAWIAKSLNQHPLYSLMEKDTTANHCR